jgi:hypothetical protein
MYTMKIQSYLKDYLTTTVFLSMLLLLTNCQIIESKRDRAFIKKQMSKFIEAEFKDELSVKNIWIVNNGKSKQYNVIVENPNDKNIEFQYTFLQIRPYEFNETAFRKAYAIAQQKAKDSYQYRTYTKTTFPNASAKTHVMITKDGKRKRMAHVYVYETLEKKEAQLQKIDSLCQQITSFYSEPFISFHFYFSENNELPKIPISENEILKYDIFYDLYQYHYRVDYTLTDSFYQKTDETLTLNLSGPIAMTLQKHIKNWLGESTYPETESDSNYLVVDRTIEKDVIWAAFKYKDTSAQPKIGYINVFTKEIKTEKPF